MIMDPRNIYISSKLHIIFSAVSKLLISFEVAQIVKDEIHFRYFKRTQLFGRMKVVDNKVKDNDTYLSPEIVNFFM